MPLRQACIDKIKLMLVTTNTSPSLLALLVLMWRVKCVGVALGLYKTAT